MITNRVPMTVEGAQALKDELKHLKEVERPNISKAIGEARELGDLKENAEYHAAKEQQGMIEAKIKYLQSQINQAQIIDITKISNQGRVIFGATVTLVNLADDKELTVRLVGEEEADIKAGKMSITAPIARASVGKEIGDVVEVQLPDGISEYEIMAIEHIG